MNDATLDDRPAPHVLLKPYPHQSVMYRMIERQVGTYDGSDMGTGKTKSLIDAIVNLGLRRSIITCPKSALDVWPDQFKEHAARPVSVVVLQGTVARRAQQMIGAYKSESDMPLVFVTNFASFQNRGFELACRRPWDLIAIDESHLAIKGPQGVMSKAMWRLACFASRRVILTGTLLPHSPLDCFSQLRFIDDRVFGRYVGRFKREYAVFGGFNGREIVGWRNLGKMNRLIYSIGRRVRRCDVLDLLPVSHERRTVELGPDARRIYRELETELVADVKEHGVAGVIVAANGLVKVLRLMQVTSGFGCVERNTWDEKRIVQIDTAKRRELADIFESIDKDEPIVVFCYFHNDLDTIHAVAKEAERASYELSGRMRRKPNVATELSIWQASTGGEVIAVQIKAGGVSIDATRAAYAVCYSIGNVSPGTIDQAMARLDRQGQTRSVTYLHLVARSTIDVAAYAALRAKKKIIEAVLGSLGGR